jgi:hypothetical protein
MTQQTFTPGGVRVAEPPAPILPEGNIDGGGDNRRKLQMVGAAAGVAVLAIVAFFLLKGGGSPATDKAMVVPHHPPKVAAAPAQPPVVKLPKHVAAPVGRDPFKALYTAPVAAAPGTTSASSSTSTTPATGGTTPTTTTTGTGTTTTTPTYHPVWVQLKSFTTTAATFDVGYSNGKTLKAVRFSGIKPLHTFGSHFELLSIRNGVVTVKYGDGSPFQLDRSHNTMVVD